MKKSWIKRTSKDPRKKLITALDRAFSVMIRERDKQLGCITCGRQAVMMDCGHFRPRGMMSTRWNPMNCNGQCLKCNRFDSKGYEYGLALDRKYTQGTAQMLFKLSQEKKQWSEIELDQLRSAARKGYRVYLALYNELYPMKVCPLDCESYEFTGQCKHTYGLVS